MDNAAWVTESQALGRVQAPPCTPYTSPRLMVQMKSYKTATTMSFKCSSLWHCNEAYLTSA